MNDGFNRRSFLAASAGMSVAAAPSAAGRKQLTDKQLEGIYIIMQTPFHDNLEIDEESLRRECDFLVRCRVHGMVWAAGAGEIADSHRSSRPMRHTKT